MAPGSDLSIYIHAAAGEPDRVKTMHHLLPEVMQDCAGKPEQGNVSSQGPGYPQVKLGTVVSLVHRRKMKHVLEKHSTVCISRTKWDNLYKTPCGAWHIIKRQKMVAITTAGILICENMTHIYGTQVITEWNILFCVNAFDYRNGNAILHLHYILLFMKQLHRYDLILLAFFLLLSIL